MNRTASRLFLAAGVAFALLPAGACGGNGRETAPGARRLFVVLGGVPTTNDPVACADDLTDTVLVNVFQQVLDPSAPPEYSACRAWTNPDETTWDLELRQGLRFHDGSPVRAADVAASIETLIRETAAPYHPFTEGIEAVTVPRPGVVRLRTHGVRNLTTVFTLTPVLPGGRRPAPDAAPVGSGPYRVAEWSAGGRIVLQRWAQPVEGSDDGPDEVVILQILEEPDQLRLIRTMTPAVGISLLRGVRHAASGDGLTVVSGPGRSAWYAVCDLRPGSATEPLAVRRALAASLDPAALAAKLGLEARPADDIVPPNVVGWRRGRFRADPSWLETFPKPYPALRFVAMDSTRKAAAILAGQLRERGWPVTLDILPVAKVLETLKNGGWDLSLIGFTVASGDVMEMFGFAFDPGASDDGGNLSAFRDGETARLMEAARRTLDPAIRLEGLQRLADRVTGRLPWIPLVVTDRWAVLHGPVTIRGGFPSRWWLTRVETTP